MLIEHKSWMNWLNALKLLSSLRIPRWYFNSSDWTQCHSNFIDMNDDADTIVNKQLHIFCDASLKAYAAVVYWRFTRADGKVIVCLLAAKVG